MMTLVIFGILICLAILYIVWQYFELKKFSVTEYHICSHKIQQEHRLAVIADLHGFVYGENNHRLIRQIKAQEPELILIAGDMIVSKEPATYHCALETLGQLLEIAPVYYGYGNHESKAEKRNVKVAREFSEYRKQAEALGVCFLQNQNKALELGKDRLWVSGLEIALSYYEKGKSIAMDNHYVADLMGRQKADSFQILLAHNPMYSEQYAAWGADVTFCGHNHGGLIQIPGIGSLLSPQMTFFPKYHSGLYEIAGKKVIVSRGLGTHTFHIRIFNRAELVMVGLFPKVLEKYGKNE